MPHLTVNQIEEILSGFEPRHTPFTNFVRSVDKGITLVTTIAFDGKILAADRQCSCDYKMSMTKIFHWKENKTHFMFAGAGAVQSVLQLQDWLQNNKIQEYHESLDEDMFAEGILVTVVNSKLTQVALYNTKSCFPVIIEDGTFSIGSGSAFAKTAMHLGKNAVDAIRIASQFDSDTGMGINSISIDSMKVESHVLH